MVMDCYRTSRKDNPGYTHLERSMLIAERFLQNLIKNMENIKYQW